MIPQYFGVAATMSRHEVDRLMEFCRRFDLPAEVKFMNGPLVSRKTLVGASPSNPDQYLPLDRVPELLSPDPKAFNVIHMNTRDPNLCNQLSQVASLSNLVHGIQMNILWPDRLELMEFRRKYPHVGLILQLSKTCLESVGSDLEQLVDRVGRYNGLVDGVLFDPSSGTGVSYDRSQAEVLLSALVESGLDMRWGVTGGLSAERVLGLYDLLQIYSGLCWDAQTKLRSQVDGVDVLDLEKCFGFCAASSALLAL